jgi:REP element-mobilizing transposase RayT
MSRDNRRMSQPIVIAYHLIWTVYGTWLPNDPRGSGSNAIATDVLKDLGELHFGRKSIQPPSRDIREFYQRATPLLDHEVLTLDRAAIASAACGLANAIAEHRYTCYACAAMPDHVHLVVRKHKNNAEEMLKNINLLSRKRLVEEGHRAEDHPVWTGGDGWKVFLDHPDDIHRTILYVDQNPAKSRLPPQRWDFVSAYDGWPLHPGHSLHSPYVKALRAAGRYSC